METPAIIIETLFERGEAYGKTSYELAKLKSLEAVIKIATYLMSRFSAIIMLLLFVLVLNIGIALWLGELLGKIYYGFFIVSAVDFVAAIALYFFFRIWIKKTLSDLIITQAL